jgi:hypothetical protein
MVGFLLLNIIVFLILCVLCNIIKAMRDFSQALDRLVNILDQSNNEDIMDSDEEEINKDITDSGKEEIETPNSVEELD